MMLYCSTTKSLIEEVRWMVGHTKCVTLTQKITVCIAATLNNVVSLTMVPTFPKT